MTVPRPVRPQLRGWRDRQVVKPVLLTIFAAFLVGYVLVALGMLVTAPRRNVVTVPDVRWKPIRQARRLLSRSDLELEMGDSFPNRSVPAGSVLAQSPLPGQEVAPGVHVRVLVSSGRQRTAIPSVAMLSRGQAERVLRASGFVVQVQEVPNLRAAGRVLGTAPAGGTTLPVPSPVRLLISAGPPMVAVPSLVGAAEAQLQSLLDGAGLEMGEVRRVFDLQAAEGLILSQSPEAGDSTRMGSRVNVVVATRELPGTPTEEVH